MKKNLLETIEENELIEKLNKNGFNKLVEILLMNESEVYTKKGRLNKSGACRLLGVKPKELEEILEHAKDLLKKDFD
jgi:hypothetical protein